MRAFHMTWLAFFASFFAWFGVAPLMPLVREDLGLSAAQVGDTIVASVALTALARVAIGPLCQRLGPRRTYAWLFLAGALPVLGIALVTSYEQLLVLRLLIGAIGAAFVVSQIHTSLMFAPGCVGAANAITAGLGNAGAGASQIAMPLLVSGLLALGLHPSAAWRVALLAPGLLLIGVGVA
jgi:NNP family nitrate/nitrite transporter-like MFS transporter